MSHPWEDKPVYNPGVKCLNYGDQCQNYVRDDDEYCLTCQKSNEEYDQFVRDYVSGK